MKLWNRKWQYESRKSNKQFLFIHIPKTAGTTFRFILYNHFRESNIYPSNSDLLNNDGEYLSQYEFLSQKKIINKSMLIGHFNFNVIEEIGRPVKTLAFFRNPIDRVFSAIRHIKKYNPEFINTDFNEIVDKNIYQILYLQSRTMGYDLKARNFKKVENNIKSLDFIGITEYFDESIQLCNETFGWQLENIAPENKINLEVYSSLSPKTMSKISKLIIPELQTYNVALNQFRIRCNKQGIRLI